MNLNEIGANMAREATVEFELFLQDFIEKNYAASYGQYIDSAMIEILKDTFITAYLRGSTSTCQHIINVYGKEVKEKANG